MQIIPIQITATNWQSYLDVCRQVVRRLDADCLSTETPSSFLATLSKQSPNFVLQKAYLWRLTEHAFMTFLIVELPIDVKAAFSECGYIAVTELEDNVSICSGTLTQFYNIIICLASKFRSKDQRLLANGLFLSLDRAGYRPIFSDYERATLEDGTFELCKRK